MICRPHFPTVYEDQITLVLLLFVRNIQQLFYEHALALIISYPTRESIIIVFLEKKTPPKLRLRQSYL